MIKVMVIDDEPEIRKLLHKMVEKQPDYQVVSECGDFSGAVVEFTRYKPDVVFMDIDLKGESGSECAKVLTELNPRLKVIFATAHSEYMANAFEIYAFDYLVKPFEVVELVARVEAVLRRYHKADPMLSAGDVVVDVEAHQVMRGGRLVELTNKEFGLLLLFLRNKNVALFRETLYEKVWEGEYTGDSRTVDLHVQRLRRKLGWENCLVTVYKVGYRLEVPQ